MAPTGLYQRLSNYIMDGKSVVNAVGGSSRIDMLIEDKAGKEPQPVLSTTAAAVISVRSLFFVCLFLSSLGTLSAHHACSCCPF
jgi:hypothetical protein